MVSPGQPLLPTFNTSLLPRLLVGTFLTKVLYNVESAGSHVRTRPFMSTRGIVADTTSSRAFDRAALWLKECLENHEECGGDKEGDENYMPRRLLDMGVPGTQNNNEEEQARIHLVEDATETAPYAALSYCWGSDLTGVVKTLTCNKKNHIEQGVPVSSLPKTVQDAVAVCRGLGLRYLWVDALCIIQDDKADWKLEGEKMRAVYHSSRVTIAAHAAVSCKDGFLGPQAYGKPEWQCEFSAWVGPGTCPEKVFARTGNPRLLGPRRRRPRKKCPVGFGPRVSRLDASGSHPPSAHAAFYRGQDGLGVRF